MTVPGQQPVSYAYDPTTGALATITHGSSTFTWHYDELGRLTSAANPNVKAAYEYNDMSRVTRVHYTASDDSDIGELRYAYDRAGRVAELAGSLANVSIPTTATPVTYDDANRLNGRNGQAFQYDDNGNLTGDGVRAYSWNARNQLAE